MTKTPSYFINNLFREFVPAHGPKLNYGVKGLFFACIFLLNTIGVVRAQNKYLIDSLEKRVHTEKNLYMRVKYNIMLTDEYKEFESDRHVKYLSAALAEVGQITDLKQRTDMRLRIALVQSIFKDTVAALRQLNIVKREIEPSNDAILKGMYLAIMGNYWRMYHKETEAEHERILFTLRQSIELLKEADPPILCRSYFFLALFHQSEHRLTPEVIKLCEDWMKKIAEINDPFSRAKNYSNISIIYRQLLRRTSDAFQANSLSLKNYLLIKDSIKIGEIMFNNGTYVRAYNNKAEGLKMMYRAIDILQRNQSWNPSKTYYYLSDHYHSLGSLCYKNKSFDSSLAYLNMSHYYNNLLNDKRTEPFILGDIAAALYEKGYKDSAYSMQLKVLALRKKYKIGEGVVFSYGVLARIKYNNKQYDSSIYFCEKALHVADSTRMKHYNDNLYSTLYLSYIGMKDHESALKYYQMATSFRDSVNKTKNEKEISEILNKQKEELLKAEFDKKQALSALEIERNRLILDRRNKELLLLEQENDIKAYNLERSKSALYQNTLKLESHKKAIENLNLDRKVKELESKRKSEDLKQQRKIIAVISIGAGLMLVLLFYVFRSYRQKKKDNEIILKQKKEADEQKKVIEEKQKEIIDSINYAKRIQSAILATEEHILEHLPESFLVYKPKDIVAGDFYFFEHIGQFTYYAAADCTGHGVPGALVSVVCSNALARSINEFGLRDTGKILDKTRDLVLETLRKSGQEVKDGMDISLVRLQSGHTNIQWSGANNPLWFIKSGELGEITADKQPIGLTEHAKAFTSHEIDLRKGDSVYLFTDGYADQFGGPKGKKFKYKQLSQLLIQHAAFSMKDQRVILEKTLQNWKGDLEQVDDICIIGFRL